MRRTILAPYSVVLEAALTPRELNQAQRRYGGKPVGDADAHGSTFSMLHIDYPRGACDCGGGLGGRHVLIYLSPRIIRAGNRHLAQTIAHEATHAALYVFDPLSVRYDADHSEPLAYLVDWITGWLWQQAKGKP